MEKEPSIGNNPEEIPEEKREDSVDFTRHSKSAYRTYEKIFKSDNPTAGFNKEEQVTPDLPEAGIEFAKQEAEKFFELLNPGKDVLFFASSSEARAIETANIYREIAKEKGFEVIKPEHPRSKISEEISDGEIRVVKELSIYDSDNAKNVIIDSVFQLANRDLINWDAVDPELKVKYEEAVKIVEADNQGSFGANMAKHGDKVKEIFPEIETAEDQFKGKFKNLKRLAKFGIKKAKESGQEKNVKILAFGHENYMIYAIESLFQEEGIKNCETMHIEAKGDGLTGKFRGKEVNL
ncbi:MAG: hypothetical protein EXS48_02725 [Candidatus Staskawiczbacteria bacterium]|nr:hypothetical protein [Candidatus Staskawiczbacteria bacterium]